MKFSVVIPTYNRAAFLPATLDSVIRQDLPPEEIIVIDDGSTDDTAFLVQQEYPNVQYHFMRNSGPGIARYRGTSLASQEWIAFCDSDDIWEPNHLSTLREVHGIFPKAGFVFSNHCNFRDHEDGVFYDHFASAPLGWWDREVMEENGHACLLRDEAIIGFIEFNPAWPSVSTVHRSVLSRCGATNEHISRLPSEDDDLTRRMVVCSQPACSTRITVRLRKHEGNFSSNQINNEIGRAFVLLHGLRDHGNLFERYRSAFLAQAQRQLLDAYRRALWSRRIPEAGHIYAFLKRIGVDGLARKHHVIGWLCSLSNFLTYSLLDRRTRELLYEERNVPVDDLIS